MGALIIRIGFGCILYYNYIIRTPQDPILIFKVPTLLEVGLTEKGIKGHGCSGPGIWDSPCFFTVDDTNPALP